MPYEPSDNDYNDDFDPAKIEQMEVELETCPNCNGWGWVGNGIHAYNCPKCFGTGSAEKKLEG